MDAKLAKVHCTQSKMDLLEGVKHFPPELKEKILSELIRAKINDRTKMGWEKVHKELVEYIEQLGKKNYTLSRRFEIFAFPPYVRMLSSPGLQKQVERQSERGVAEIF